MTSKAVSFEICATAVLPLWTLWTEVYSSFGVEGVGGVLDKEMCSISSMAVVV